MSGDIKTISDHWDSYGKIRDGVFMIISFDDGAGNGDQPEALELCARIIIPINETKPDSTLPIDSEEDFLYQIEDEIVDALIKEKVSCRLVARLTYDGLRELVFQVENEEDFRPVIGTWIEQHATHDIDVSEHDGWGFFNDYIKPTEEDRWLMTENRVIDNLLKNGSIPELEHQLEYCFYGEPADLEKISEALNKKGYHPLGELDFDSGQMVMSIAMTLDRPAIFAESKDNQTIASKHGGRLDGWGALSVTGE